MSRPEAHDPADILRSHLRTIRDLWPEMLPTLKAAPISGGTSTGARTSTAGDDDNGTHNRDVARLDIIVSARCDVLAVLKGWCRVIIEDWDVQKRTPNGGDMHSMVEFIDRWALTFSEHEAFEDALDEIRDASRTVRQIARPPIRDSVWIGDCPVTIGRDGDRVECGTAVRVRSGEPIRCKGCDTEDTLDGWILRIVGHHEPVTTAQLIPLLKQRMGIHATPTQIRQWVHRGVIATTGTRDDGRSLFDRADVFARLAYRETHTKARAMV